MSKVYTDEIISEFNYYDDDLRVTRLNQSGSEQKSDRLEVEGAT